MAINKVEFGGQTLIDLTEDTVTPSTLMAGETAHDRSGAAIVGTATGGSSTLAQLTDVNLTNLSDGQIIKYNSTSQKWENVDAGSSDDGAVRIISETIFEAIADTEVNVDYTLTHSIDDYSFISIYNGVWSEYAGSGSKWVEDAFIPVQSLNAIYDAGKQYAVTSYDTRYLHLTLHNTTLRVIARSNLAVCKIVGHKIVGGSDIVHLTKAEYDALPDTKLSDNKIYMIDDVPSGDTEDKHIILDSEDVVYPQRSFLQFTGNASIVDDETNNKTVVDITGGGAEIVEMTQAEYDALPDTKLTDGVLRAIKDEYSPADSKLVGLGDCYSTSEREVGCWVDGKPLYQKTLIYVNATQGRVDNLAHNIADVDYIFVSTWEFREHGGGSGIIGFENTGLEYWANMFVINSIGISYRIGTSWSAGDLYITVKYTKTTDIAGSGTWTPEGTPTHQYDESEKVVGTWFGETLYEKTFTELSIALNGDNWVYWNVGLAIGKLIALDAYTMNSNRLQHCAIAEYMYDSTNGIMLSGFSGYNRTVTIATIRYTKIS